MTRANHRLQLVARNIGQIPGRNPRIRSTCTCWPNCKEVLLITITPGWNVEIKMLNLLRKWSVTHHYTILPPSTLLCLITNTEIYRFYRIFSLDLAEAQRRF